MKAVSRLLSCLVLLLALASCEQDPVAPQPKSDRFGVSYWLDSTYSRTVHFHLNIPEKVMLLGLSWDFGDGTVQRISPDTAVTHTYAKVGDYRVRVGSDLTDSAKVWDTTMVRLKSRVTQFSVNYWLESDTSRVVHFSLDYPKGFVQDSLLWDFGDGVKKWLPCDTSISHAYVERSGYTIRVSGAIVDTIQVLKELNLSLFILPPSTAVLRQFKFVRVTFSLRGDQRDTQTGGVFEATGNWHDSLLDMKRNNERIKITVQANGEIKLDEQFDFVEEVYDYPRWSYYIERQTYQVIDIGCDRSNDSAAVFRVAGPAANKRLAAYNYSSERGPHGRWYYRNLEETLGYVNYVQVEFFGR